MSNYQQLVMNREPQMPVGNYVAHDMGLTRRRWRISRLAAWLLAGLIEVVLLLGVLQMAVGLGYEGEAGPMPAPSHGLAL